MRTTIDIPDPLYRQLKGKAASEGRSVKELVLRGVEQELGTAGAKPGVFRFQSCLRNGPERLTWTMPRFSRSFHFPDVNVWIALTYGGHIHHSVAKSWFDCLDMEARVCFCRFTQLSLLRLLTTQAVMGSDEVMTQRQAWDAYDRWLTDGRVIFLDEPRTVDAAFRSLSDQGYPNPKTWSDSYLAAFAAVSGLQLVTFDRDFKERLSSLRSSDPSLSPKKLARPQLGLAQQLQFDPTLNRQCIHGQTVMPKAEAQAQPGGWSDRRTPGFCCDGLRSQSRPALPAANSGASGIRSCAPEPPWRLPHRGMKKLGVEFFPAIDLPTLQHAILHFRIEPQRPPGTDFPIRPGFQVHHKIELHLGKRPGKIQSPVNKGAVDPRIDRIQEELLAVH